MERSKKLMRDIKTTLEKEHGRPFSEEEVEKVAAFMKHLAKMQVDIFLEDQERQRRLEASPGGFHLEKKGYSCRICEGPASGDKSWFDGHGLKCRICQEAINQQIIPPSVATDRDSWYSPFELEIHFGLTAPTRRKWIKKGHLVSRTIMNGKQTHLQLFLPCDNQDMLPPKALVDSRPVIGVINGQEWQTSRPWYRFVEPHQHLKGYKILEYLNFVTVDTAK